jgi:signal transduction histidine kinase/CheY-like chemotaxis protein
MTPAALPADEANRLACLRGLQVLDTAADPALDGLMRCAAAITACPIALVSLVDEQRQWFKARLGLTSTQTPRDVAFCAHAILGEGLFEVPDAHADPRFADSPLVTGDSQIAFYAGVPLRVGEFTLGALCVMDRVPRRLDETQRARLADLAAAATQWLEARREQVALARSEERLADFARAASDWLWECDHELVFRWTSEGYEERSGLPVAALYGTSMADAPLLDELGEPLHPPQTLRAHFLRGERIDGLRIERHYPTGRRFLKISALPRRDAEGRLLGWRGVVRDVSDLVAARRAANERRQVLEKTSRLVPGVIFQQRWRADGESEIPFASGRVEDLYEIAAGVEPLDAAVVFDRLHPDERAGFLESVRQSAKTMSPWHHEYRVVLPQRGVRWLEGHATPESDGEGGVVWHGFITDVTLRRRRDAEMLESRQRRRVAEQASRDKSAFLSRLSHELRTPLNAVLGFTQLLQSDRRQPLLPVQRERVDQVQRAGVHLMGLLDDVLDIGRIEHQGRALELRPVSLARVLDDALMLITPQAQALGVSIERPAGIGSLFLQADKRALRQVLTNLVSNGVKYNKRGGCLRITVRVLEREATVELHDQGAGIAPQRLAELFQPFNRLGAENSGIQGSGLGLVIVRQLTEAMHGRLEVDSEPGLGSVFRLRLPLSDDVSSTLPVPLELEQTPNARRATLLYIEDEPVNALLLGEALREQPHWRLVVAHDGVEGLAKARSLHPELVLTDINLPGLTGLEVVRALRGDPATRDIGCIALSADALPEQIERARLAGCDDYWTKPLDLKQVVRRIADRLARMDEVAPA